MSDIEQIRVILFQEAGHWVAQCLEYDIGAQAGDLDELQVRLSLTLSEECKESIARHGKPFAGIDPAPDHFHKLWKERVGGFNPKRPFEVPIDMAFAKAA